MKVTLCVLFIVLGMAVNVTVADDGIKEGEWSGWVHLGGENRKTDTNVTITPGEDDKKKTKIIMSLRKEEMLLEFIDLKIRKSGLNFKINTGALQDCDMKQQEDGSYKGNCTYTAENGELKSNEIFMKYKEKEKTE